MFLCDRCKNDVEGVTVDQYGKCICKDCWNECDSVESHHKKEDDLNDKVKALLGMDMDNKENAYQHVKRTSMKLAELKLEEEPDEWKDIEEVLWSLVDNFYYDYYHVLSGGMSISDFESTWVE